MKKEIKILLVSPFFFPTNTYQQELCQKITELYPNIKISVLCYKTTKAKLDKFNDLPVYYISCINLLKDQFVLPNYFELIKTLKKLNQENRFDLLLTETRFFDSAFWLPFLAKKWQIPCILVDHCASSIKHSSKLVMFLGKIIDWFLFKFILNRYSYIACSNQAVFDYLSNSKIRNLKMIGTGVDSDFFTPDKRKIPKEQITVSFVSRLLKTKGVELFYQAIKPLTKKYPKVKFVVAGGGPMFQEIKRKINADRNSDRIEQTGALSKEKIAQLLADTDIFVYPSFHHDGIANVLLEAGASGCAVIAGNSGGTKELIKNEENGILLNDLSVENIRLAIEDLILDKKKRLRFASALKDYISKNYHWSFVAQKTAQLIFKAVGLA